MSLLEESQPESMVKSGNIGSSTPVEDELMAKVNKIYNDKTVDNED